MLPCVLDSIAVRRKLGLKRRDNLVTDMLDGLSQTLQCTLLFNLDEQQLPSQESGSFASQQREQVVNIERLTQVIQL